MPWKKYSRRRKKFEVNHQNKAKKAIAEKYENERQNADDVDLHKSVTGEDGIQDSKDFSKPSRTVYELGIDGSDEPLSILRPKANSNFVLCLHFYIFNNIF